jgi:hypothetical protein
MMTQDEALNWATKICTKNGTYEERMKYLEKFGVGEFAEKYWNDPVFTYGIEYGILIAVAKIYDNLQRIR